VVGIIKRLMAWEPDPGTRVGGVLVRAGQLLILTWEQCVRDKVIIRASGLAYATLLATVPLVVVGFALFSAFSAFEDLKQRVQDLLLAQMVPTRQDEIAAFLNGVSESVGRLGLVGFIFLVATAILLLDNVEANFNDIWHVKTKRKLVNKITAYTSVLFFGTLFIGASLSISAKVKAMIFAGAALDLGPLSRAGTWAFTLALTLLAFLLMYLIVPFTRVQLRSAALGAAAASVLWELGKNVFASSVGSSVRYSTLYGSLAVIPIFLIWLYITWIIVLAGLELAFTHQSFLALLRASRQGGHFGRNRLTLALRIYLHVAKAFRDRQEPLSCDGLGRLLEVPGRVVESVVDGMVGTGLLRRASASTSNDGLVPATSLEGVQLVEVVDTVLGAGEIGADGSSGVDRIAGEVVAGFLGGGHRALGEQTVAELLAESED